MVHTQLKFEIKKSKIAGRATACDTGRKYVQHEHKVNKRQHRRTHSTNSLNERYNVMVRVSYKLQDTLWSPTVVKRQGLESQRER